MVTTRRGLETGNASSEEERGMDLSMGLSTRFAAGLSEPMAVDSDSDSEWIPTEEEMETTGEVMMVGVVTNQAATPSTSGGNYQPEAQSSSNSGSGIPDYIQLVGDRFKCITCQKEFRTRSYIKSHEYCGKEKPYKCVPCNKSFVFKSHYNYHQVSQHSKVRPFACNQCSKRFCRKRELKRHQTVHSGEKPFNCNTCGRSFTSNQMLTTHIRLHTGEKPFACETCDKRFHSKTLLKRHILIHTGDTPHRCKICRKSFRLSSQLSVHMSSHSCEKRFKCDECSMSFTTKRDATRHKEAVHCKLRPYKCGTCGMGFSRKDNYVRHCRTQHNITVNPQVVPQPTQYVSLAPVTVGAAERMCGCSGQPMANVIESGSDSNVPNVYPSEPQFWSYCNMDTGDITAEAHDQIRRHCQLSTEIQTVSLVREAITSTDNSNLPAYETGSFNETNPSLLKSLLTCRNKNIIGVVPPTARTVQSTSDSSQDLIDAANNNPVFLAVLHNKSKEELANVVKEGGTWRGIKNENGDSVLHVAVKLKNRNALSYFLPLLDKEEILVNDKGRTLLHEAVCCGEDHFMEFAELLVDLGEDINATVDNKGNNLCSLAVLKGFSEMALRRFVLLGADWKGRNKSNESILQMAVKANNVEALSYFISKGADVNAQDETGNTLLHKLPFFQISSESFQGILSILVSNKANINARNASGTTPFHYAAACKFGEDLQAMLNHGALLDARNNMGFAPVHAAVAEGNAAGLKFLISKGVNIKALSNENRTPLHEVAFAKKNFIQLVKVLTNEEHKLIKTWINSADLDGNTPLLYCILLRRSVDEIKCLLDRGADWRVKNKKGDGVLDLAVNVGDLDIIKYFVEERGANVNTKNKFGGTPLHHVAPRNFKEIVSYLVSEKQADINATDKFGNTLLMIATREGRSKKDLEHVVSLKGDWTLKNLKGMSILHFAAQAKQACQRTQKNSPVAKEAIKKAKKAQREVIKYFISLGADVNARCKDGKTPMHHLMYAKTDFIISNMRSFVKKGDNANAELEKLLNAVDNRGHNVIFCATALGRWRKLLRVLVKHGANWQAVNNKGLSILHTAIEKGNLRAAKYFLELGANVKAKTSDGQGETPLHQSRFAKKNLAEILELLKENGADINERTEPNGNNLLLLSAGMNKPIEELQLIVKAGASFQPNNYGYMVLHATAQNGNLEGLKYFISERADVNATTHDGRQPLHFLARTQKNFREMLDILLKKGVDINAADQSGNTLLHLIAQDTTGVRTEEDLKYLVKSCHASLDMKNAERCTALHVASLGGNVTGVKYFSSEMQTMGIKMEDDNEGPSVVHCAIEGGNLEVLKYLKQQFGMDFMKFNGTCCGKTLLEHVGENQEEMRRLLLEYMRESRCDSG